MPTVTELISLKESVSSTLLGPPDDPISPAIPFLSYLAADALALAGKNVHAVGVGVKVVNSRATDQWCIRLYVHRKLPEGELPRSLRLPAELDGVPTDIIQSRPPVPYGRRLRGTAASRTRKGKHKEAQKDVRLVGAELDQRLMLDAKNLPLMPEPAFPFAAAPDPRGHFRPIIGGVCGANQQVIDGTLGCTCRPVGGAVPLVLSCHHVLSPGPGSSVAAIFQPTLFYGGGFPEDRVGTFTRGIGLVAGQANRIDAAVATIVPELGGPSVISGIGQLSSPQRPRMSQLRVRKFGSATRYRTGLVSDVSYDTTIPWPTGAGTAQIRVIDQLRIEGDEDGRPFAGRGDSGSIVVEEVSQTPLGLVFAGDLGEGYTLANQLVTVFELLGVSLM